MIVHPAQEETQHIPKVPASTLLVAGTTAAAVLVAINVDAEDTVLIGGAAGGAGMFAVQLACLAGAREIGTCAVGSFEFLRAWVRSPSPTAPA